MEVLDTPDPRLAPPGPLALIPTLGTRSACKVDSEKQWSLHLESISGIRLKSVHMYIWAMLLSPEHIYSHKYHQKHTISDLTFLSFNTITKSMYQKILQVITRLYFHSQALFPTTQYNCLSIPFVVPIMSPSSEI